MDADGFATADGEGTAERGPAGAVTGGSEPVVSKGPGVLAGAALDAAAMDRSGANAPDTPISTINIAPSILMPSPSIPVSLNLTYPNQASEEMQGLCLL